MTTQYSPYFLMFGREARYPREVTDNYEVSILHVNDIIFFCKQSRSMRTLGILLQRSVSQNALKGTARYSKPYRRILVVFNVKLKKKTGRGIIP